MKNIFGMFIHWGIYSQLGLHEQALARYDLDKSEYEKLSETFDPINYDPEEWVMLAKNAGMKYICFTAKHHDGFCMWDTKFTDYNITNTPYKKDVLKMLSDACRKHDLKLSLYYSCPDWHHEHGYNERSSHQWKANNDENCDFEKYRKYIIDQVTELLTNYGKIYTLFWDIPPKIKDESINALVRKLQPEILINNRGFDEGDFSTPERDESGELPTRHFEKLTEACNSVGVNSWGYRKNENYHSIRYLTHSINRIMALGGSYLLNVGPMPDGKICEKEKSIIERVGRWYVSTEESLEGCAADNFDYGIKDHKCIVNKKNGKSYFNFYEGIFSEAVYFERFHCLPKSVRLLNTGTYLECEISKLPRYFDGSNGKCSGDFLVISKIPVDNLENEPIIIEIEW